MIEVNRHHVLSFLMIIFSLTLTFNSWGSETKKSSKTAMHSLSLFPKGQHFGYIEGFNPDNSPKLRKVMDRAFVESVRNGMKVTRIQMDWTDLEPTKGVYHQQL